jgi:hypothetical protein
MTRKDIITLCKECGIVVQKGEATRQLITELRKFFADSAVVREDDGDLIRKQTEKVTGEYFVDFTISGYYAIRAESEEVAREWVEERLYCDFNPSEYECTEITNCKILNSCKIEED